MLRGAGGRATAPPSSPARAPKIDRLRIDAEAPAASAFDRYATVMLAVTAGCLPLYVVRWKYGLISTTLLELLVIATIGLYLVGRRQEGALRFNRTPYDMPIVLLLIAGASAVFVPMQ